MSYTFTTDSIEVRTSREGDKPRYIVRGKAMVAGVKDTYRYDKNKDGTYKTLHSIFTKNCIDKIKKQAPFKKYFVDAQHSNILDAQMVSMLKGKLSDEELKEFKQKLGAKEMPLAKITSLDIEDNQLIVETELNPAFRSLNKEHEVYFDSTWSSLQNKFLNGISVNMANTHYDYDADGNKVIDDAEIIGFSYVDAPASHENSIMEVAIRAMTEGTKMTEPKKNEIKAADVEAMKKELEAKNTELEAIKTERAKAEADAKQKAADDQKKTVEEQMAEQKKINEDLQKRINDVEAKAAAPVDTTNSAKGVVAQVIPPTQPTQPAADDPKVYTENLKKITAKHDETVKLIKEGKSPNIDNRMEGMGELVNLQAKINNPTAGMEFEHPEDERLARKLMEKGQGDIVVNKNK